jgi:GT2 family glycosyltransferase
MAATATSVSLAVVAIGRNEGDRLVQCLRSVVGQAALVIYVDSGSTDGSVDKARASGAEVVELDLRQPFTAARARNAGWRACQTRVGIEYVQFVDGDCEVVAGWLPLADRFLSEHTQVAAVCGRRRERFPERSVYNRLCDDEWDTPVGATRACGGDVMVRISALDKTGGYRDELIAGEDTELCFRLRALGWQIWCLDAPMTLHDAAMTRFPQWWTRCRRAGYAFAEGAFLHGTSPERYFVRETRSARAWAVAIPLLIALAVALVGPVALVGLVAYPLQIARIAIRGKGALSRRSVRAAFLVLGRFPEAVGQLGFFIDRIGHRRRPLIEYK